MHDPNTVAFDIYLGRKKTKSGRYKSPLITIWHKDPEKQGDDDSCGWFMRDYHGDQLMRERIRKTLDSEFDRTYTSESDGKVYYVGYFSPNSGMPNLSTMGITLDMFSKASWEFFNYDRKKQKIWMQKNLYDILHFAENNTDSLKDEIQGTFRIGTGEEWRREDALNHYTSIIYGWLLRRTRPWWKHPKWHVHHWRIQFHPIQNLKRRFWDKCCVCGKRGFKGSAYSDWNGDKLWHAECDNSRHKPVTR